MTSTAEVKTFSIKIEGYNRVVLS